MDIRAALCEQFHGGLAMLRECIAKCPDDLWISPNPPCETPDYPDNPEWNGIERTCWRIAFHNIYFTHLYLGQGEESFVPPLPDLAVRTREEFADMWQAPWRLEPYELPLGTPPCTQSEILEYLKFVDDLVDETIAGLNLDSDTSGFSWYPNESKISHLLLNLRHLQGHVGQLSELLMLRGIDIQWI